MKILEFNSIEEANDFLKNSPDTIEISQPQIHYIMGNGLFYTRVTIIVEE